MKKLDAKIILESTNSEILVEFYIEKGCSGDNITPPTPPELHVTNVLGMDKLGFFTVKLCFNTLDSVGILSEIYEIMNEKYIN